MTGLWILLGIWLAGNATVIGLAVHAERKARR